MNTLDLSIKMLVVHSFSRHKNQSCYSSVAFLNSVSIFARELTLSLPNATLVEFTVHCQTATTVEV